MSEKELSLKAKVGLVVLAVPVYAFVFFVLALPLYIISCQIHDAEDNREYRFETGQFVKITITKQVGQVVRRSYGYYQVKTKGGYLVEKEGLFHQGTLVPQGTTLTWYEEFELEALVVEENGG